MKSYTTYNYDFFDESIEENNSAFSTLTKKWGKNELKTNDENGWATWESGTSYLTIRQILSHIWSKEDVDFFVEENPECSVETFTVYKRYIQEDYFCDVEFSRGNYIKYCPLQEKRDKLLKDLL